MEGNVPSVLEIVFDYMKKWQKKVIEKSGSQTLTSCLFIYAANANSIAGILSVSLLYWCYWRYQPQQVSLRDGIVNKEFDDKLPDSLKVPNKSSREEMSKRIDDCFSWSYLEAKTKFLELCKKIEGARTHTLWVDKAANQSIDLAYIAGSPDSSHLIIHISGTNGVEGYAGAAIQLDLLIDIARRYEDKEKERTEMKRPHLLFVHALNPYGMQQLRCWTQFNVDLNRNCFFNETDFKRMKLQEHEKIGDVMTASDYSNDIEYEVTPPLPGCLVCHVVVFCFLSFSFSILIKSKEVMWNDDIWFDIQARFYWWNYGPNGMDRVLSGQYHNGRKMFYGGFKLAKNLELLGDFLVNNFKTVFGVSILSDIFKHTGNKKHNNKLSVIDIHTGFGQCSIDTLFTSKKSHKDVLLRLFSEYAQVPIFMQTFGTVEWFDIVKALRNENMAHQYVQKMKSNELKILEYRQSKVRDVLYLKDNWSWKWNVLMGGRHTFQRVYTRG
ncbi:hypothetical protein RFI_13690 [Reticulomyxa filosa]|uniref:Uncharacterized protein n=1 Tax=Reticulomyxa filosa TaxID=46433 RepID=X6NDS3_RETFI|nr:hypothetical protein RFI_13690 [Reticulomyxa filosa]|eukprot:ETO23492.1 hypothetical protein RFI_13690 [Reticulomyxa filosa]